MTSITVPALRHVLRATRTPVRAQRRWARVHDIRFVATQRNASSIQDRYKNKLEDKAREEGHESVEGLKEAYKDKIAEHRRNANTLGAPVRDQTSSSLLSHPPPPPPPSSMVQAQSAHSQSSNPTKSNQSSQKQVQGDGNTPGIKPLSSYVDLDKLSKLPRKEIEYIWRLRFASDSKSLCAVIPLATYQRIYTNARHHPQFILPLPRPAAEADDGSGETVAAQRPEGFKEDEARTAADIHFLQWGFHPPVGAPPVPGSQTANTHVSTILFTHLAAFKLHGAYAQPHTTVTHHLDLADSHNIVLLHGQVVDGRGVSSDEARWLLMCLQKFYDFEAQAVGADKDARRAKRKGLLEKFTHGDTDGFRVEDLLDEAERVV